MNQPAPAKTILNFEPQLVWKYFSEIAAVPRPSKKEERIRAYIRDFAERQRLVCKEDQTGNLVIRVPATNGFTESPPTVLQSHLDMVCEQNEPKHHDFLHEGIRLISEAESGSGEQIVRADGTTLGADNGIGVAMALAAATSPEVAHGPLELLFTIDEEDGMTGAKALAPKSFQGRRMLNLDSEEDDALYIGCAGGCDVNLSWTFNTEPSRGGEGCQVSVSGLRGGHSGCDIHEGRANAIKLLVRTLLRGGGSPQIVSINGGSKRNAIPREADALVVGDEGMIAALQKAGAEVAAEAMTESFEPKVSIRLERRTFGPTDQPIGANESARLLAALIAIPSGVLGMHPKIGGLVETSNNLSTIASATQGPRCVFQVGLLTRSSAAGRMHETLEQLESIGRLAGADASRCNAYPGWSPYPDSPLLAICRRMYRKILGAEPKIAAIHAGLECGIIGESVGGMDMVSLGPTIRGAHSPDERVYVASVARTWKYLVALLSALASGADS